MGVAQPVVKEEGKKQAGPRFDQRLSIIPPVPLPIRSA
jgi:hypothetical protein